MAQATSSKKRQRTCVACGKVDSKGTLRRLVRTPDGRVAYDDTGRVAGRGAYVCDADCFAAAVKAGKIGRALRIKPAPEDIKRIAVELEGGSSAVSEE